MIAFTIGVAAIAVVVLVRTLLLIRREAYGDHVSDGWRDEHFRERRDQ